MQSYKNSVLCKGLFTLFFDVRTLFYSSSDVPSISSLLHKNVRSTCKNPPLSVGELIFSFYICSTEMSYLGSTTLYNTSQK